MNVQEHSWTIVDYRGLSWTIVDYHGLSWTIVDYRGLFKFIFNFHTNKNEIVIYLKEKNALNYLKKLNFKINCHDNDLRNLGFLKKEDIVIGKSILKK